MESLDRVGSIVTLEAAVSSSDAIQGIPEWRPWEGNQSSTNISS